MSSPRQQLRIAQVICVLFTAACIILTHAVLQQSQSAPSWELGMFVLLALWSAASGFTLQRIFTRAGRRPLPSHSHSTPVSRWKVGNIMRLATAASVGLWGMVIYVFGGPSRLVDAIFGFALTLLLLWQPGPTPEIASLEP